MDQFYINLLNLQSVKIRDRENSIHMCFQRFQFLTADACRNNTVIIDIHNILLTVHGNRFKKFLVYNHFIVIALHIVDPDEESPDLTGEVDLVDMESGESVPLTVRGNTLAEYQKLHRAHMAQVAKAFSIYDATYLRISVRDDLKQIVMNTFKQQRLVRQR